MNSFEENLSDIVSISKLQHDRNLTAHKILYGDPNFEEISTWVNQYDHIDDRTTIELLAFEEKIIEAKSSEEKNMIIDSFREKNHQYMSDDMNLKTTLLFGAKLVLADILTEEGLIPKVRNNEVSYDTATALRGCQDVASLIEIAINQDLDIEDRKKITLAAEMLLLSSSVQLSFLDNQSDDAKNITNWNFHNRGYALELLKNNLDNLPAKWSESKEYITLYMNNLNTYYSYSLTTNYYLPKYVAQKNNIYLPHQILKYERNKILLEYIDNIETALLGPNSLGERSNILKSKGIEKGKRKGHLHETFWILETFLIAEFEKEEIALYSALNHQDRPILNHPKLNHGFDAVINSLSNDAHFKIQLKSGFGKSQKIYDPTIEVLTESNLNLNNEGRIRNKLNAYKEAILNDFTPEDYEKCKKLFLESSIQGMDYFQKYKKIDPMNFIKIMKKMDLVGMAIEEQNNSISTAQLTRAQRKIMKKKLREIKIQLANSQKPLIKRNPKTKNS